MNIFQFQTIISLFILVGILSCSENKTQQELSTEVQYTVVTRDNDTLELSSKFLFSPGDEALVWIWVSKTLNGLCGFVLRPYPDSKSLPESSENIHYSLIAANIIPNKPKPVVHRLPSDQKFISKNPCEKYTKLYASLSP